MPLFAVIAKEPNNSRIEKLIADCYPENNHIKIASASWLVYEEQKGMPQTIHNKIFGEGNNKETYLIIPFDAYWGIHSNDVWNWISSKGL
ncbi:hypothetical protein [Colwellia psychrerythraea]|uniref:Uncharacterized protein n=1 Tax=Colwellia psychrerythraea TaxID=28229 RepID=A0A099K803_COLPS|nr:hypothetical protein [Colwellia psychrerythraea]KGJ86425.1 hypothetical protein ND2E_0991 [Colwellia psychrerythraea]